MLFSIPVPAHFPRHPHVVATSHLLDVASSYQPARPFSYSPVLRTSPYDPHFWHAEKGQDPVFLPPQHPPPPYTLHPSTLDRHLPPFPFPPTLSLYSRSHGHEVEPVAGSATSSPASGASSSTLNTSADARLDGMDPANGLAWDLESYAREPSMSQSSTLSGAPSMLSPAAADSFSLMESDLEDTEGNDRGEDHRREILPSDDMDTELPPASGPARRARKNPKMHQCMVCSKQFPRPSGLQTHMHTHSGEKPFKCPVSTCSKRFAVRSNAKRHLRTHGIRTELAPTFPFASAVSLATPSTGQGTKNGGGMRFVPQSRGRQKVPSSLRLLAPPRQFEEIIPLEELETVPDVDTWSWAGEKWEGRIHSGEAWHGRMTGRGRPGTCLKLLPPVRPSADGRDERNSWARAGEAPYHPDEWKGMPGPIPRPWAV